jgi:hypothetical protein
MSVSQSGMSKSEKFFLILAILGLCLQIAFALVDPAEYSPLKLTTPFLMYLFVAFSIILSWLGEKLPAKAAAVFEGLRVLLILLLVVVVLGDRVPSVKAWVAHIFSYLSRQSTLLPGLFGTLALVLLAYVYFVLKDLYPLGCVRVEIFVAVLACVAAVIDFVHNRRPLKVPELLVASLLLAGAFDDHRRAPKQ